jgi:RimJ/RimL family protein N-acetyltransferase
MLETERLWLRHLTLDDAGFVLRLVNEPSWLRYIGDKHVDTLDDARAYIQNGPMASYKVNGFGLLRVSLKETGESVGMCGLLRRAELDTPDVGFAFLPEHWRKGYAFEAASAVIKDGVDRCRLRRIAAIVSPDNQASINLIRKLGMSPVAGTVQIGSSVPVLLFTGEWSPGGLPDQERI